MGRAKRVCSVPDCPNLTDGGRCVSCRGEADRERRQTPEQRAYKSAGHRKFRAAVLRRDPLCVLCLYQPSTIADHYPTSRRDLVAQDLDPNDPQHGRGLCVRCHNRSTAALQPGGWR